MHLRFALMIMVEEVWWFGPKLTIGCGDEQANEYGIMVPVDDEQRHGVHRADVCGGGSHGEYGTCRSNLTLHKTFAAKKKMRYSTSENSWVWRNGWHPPTIVDCDKHKKHVEKAMHLMLEKNNRDCLTWTEETKMHSSNAEQQWIHPKRTATNCESLLHEETSQYIALLPVISAMESTVWWIHTQFMVTKQCLLLSSRHFFFSAILLRFHTANVLQKKENQQQNMNNENVCIHISQPQST